MTDQLFHHDTYSIQIWFVTNISISNLDKKGQTIQPPQLY